MNSETSTLETAIAQLDNWIDRINTFPDFAGQYSGLMSCAQQNFEFLQQMRRRNFFCFETLNGMFGNNYRVQYFESMGFNGLKLHILGYAPDITQSKDGMNRIQVLEMRIPRQEPYIARRLKFENGKESTLNEYRLKHDKEDHHDADLDGMAF